MNAAAEQPPVAALTSEIVILLNEVTGAGADPLATIGPDTRLDGDLLLDSIEMAAFGDRLAQRYGTGVDLLGHVARLDIDEIIALRVADVAMLVAGRTGPPRGPAGGLAPGGDPRPAPAPATETETARSQAARS